MHQSDIQTCTDTKGKCMKLYNTPFTLENAWNYVIPHSHYHDYGTWLKSWVKWELSWQTYWDCIRWIVDIAAIMEKFWIIKKWSWSTWSHSIYGDCIRSYQSISEWNKAWWLITLIGINVTPCSNKIWKHHAALVFYIYLTSSRHRQSFLFTTEHNVCMWT